MKKFYVAFGKDFDEEQMLLKHSELIFHSEESVFNPETGEKIKNDSLLWKLSEEDEKKLQSIEKGLYSIEMEIPMDETGEHSLVYIFEKRFDLTKASTRYFLNIAADIRTALEMNKIHKIYNKK